MAIYCERWLGYSAAGQTGIKEAAKGAPVVEKGLYVYAYVSASE